MTPENIIAILVAMGSLITAASAFYVGIKNARTTDRQSKVIARRDEMTAMREQFEGQVKISQEQLKIAQTQLDHLETRLAETNKLLDKTRSLLDKEVHENLSLRIRVAQLAIEIIKLGGKVPPEESVSA